jgi:hypothetical protein
MINHLNECLCCGNADLKPALDLGDQPLANTYPTEKVDLPTYPLLLNFCSECGHMQLSVSVDRSSIFSDYQYVSGTTQTLRDDFADFARFVTEKHGVGTVLDIACNDGSQLDAFKELGWTTIGIDPAVNLHEINRKNHQVYCEFLNDNHRCMKADVIVAQNVVAHTDNPLHFLEICKDIAPNIYVQTSQALMIENGEFDTIYHEHISFFSESSMRELARRAGLVLANTSFRDIHGKSFLFDIRREGDEQMIAPKPSMEQVQDFNKKASTAIQNLRSVIQQERAAGRKVIGYGAAAKGMTVLNAVGEHIDYIVDDNPLKHNRLTPGLLIPILPPDEIASEESEITVIPLAWNFYAEIKNKILSRKSSNIRIIKYFPDFSIEEM